MLLADGPANSVLTPENLAGFYAAADCLVHPFRGEGFGLPVLEAIDDREVVQHHEVNVAVRIEFRPAITADGKQRVAPNQGHRVNIIAVRQPRRSGP